MNNFSKKSFRQSIITSSLIIVLCMMSLIGGTFAWFTDTETVSSRIVSGNLDVEMYYSNAASEGYENIKEMGDEPLFFVDSEGNDILWEPGVVSVCDFKVENVGNLALKYRFDTSFTDYNDAGVTAKLSDVILAAIVEKPENPFANREEAIAAGDVAGWGSLANISAEAKLSDEESEEFTVVLYWEPTDHDNDYNMQNAYAGKEIGIDIDIKLVAMQYMEEDDSYGTDYDKDAKYPPIVYTSPAELVEALASAEKGATIVMAPNAASYGTLEIPTGLEEVTISAQEGAIIDSIKIPANAEIKNVTIENFDISFNNDSNIVDFGTGAKVENLKVENCKVVANSGDKYRQRILQINGNQGTVTFENCTFENVGRGIYSPGAIGETVVKLINCTIKNSGSWALQCNGNAKEVYIEGCTFENCDGLVKIQGTGLEKFTFKNNTVLGYCAHDHKLATPGKPFSVKVTENLVFEGNTYLGEEWPLDLSLGITDATVR